ncbi:MAG: uroporphyrinogen-III synthase [Thermoanaerobaculia bacterium]|nr:uroporphyrinogen-III synthase [Thermoanaerobaculia bacterium]
MPERPLSGRRVLVTRARAQSAELVRLLEKAGAEVVHFAAIEIAPPPSWESLDAVIDSPASFQRIFFTSTNGVDAYFGRAAATGRVVSLGNVKVAAVGRATADALRRHWVEPDLVPEKFQASELLPLLDADQRGVRSAIVRALEGREVLVDELRARGGEVHVAVAYETKKAASIPDDLRAALAAGEIDALTFTSPSTVDGTLAHLTPAELSRVLASSVIASIGPVTTRALAQLGAANVVEAAESTVEGLVAALAAQFTRR